MVARPRWWRLTERWASGPVRTDAPFAPGEDVAPEDEDAQCTTSTSERPHAVGTLKDLELSEYLGGEGLVAEDLEGPVLGQHHQRHKHAAAEDGSFGLARSSPARKSERVPARGSGDLLLARVGAAQAGGHGRYTNGYTARVMTSTAPRNPSTQVDSDAQPKLTTKSGIAKGMTTSTAQIRRPGRSVRSTHHAARVPITAQSSVTDTVRRTVFQRRVAVRGRQMRSATVRVPARCASKSRNTSGASSTTATTLLAPSNPRGMGRCGRDRAVNSPVGRRGVGPQLPCLAIAHFVGRDQSEQPGLFEQGDRLRAVAQLGDVIAFG